MDTGIVRSLHSVSLAEFRAEVCRFIADHAPDIPPRAGIRSPENAAELSALQEWSRRLYDAGYAGADWPEEFGGRPEWTPQHGVIVGEELARAQITGVQGPAQLAARALIAFGTAEQRSRHLPRIRSGREVWCQLFSEPGAGSDLASLRTKAVLDGEDYVINGQKVWTTDGQWAAFGYLLARTDPDAPKHSGISAFVLDMSLPGVTVRPLRELTGTSDFNEVFFDEVRIPATSIIGAPGQGWKIANSSLAHERGDLGASVVKLRMAIDALRELAGIVLINDRPADQSSLVQDRIGCLSAEVEALAAMTSAHVERWLAGREQPQDAAMGKLMFSEINREIARYALELSGEQGVLVAGDRGVLAGGRWQDEWLYAGALTIAGGSSEIMRNLVAERGLGLPRSAR